MIDFNFGLVRNLARASVACVGVWSAASVGGCATSSHAFRLNPEQEPEQYRVTCKKRFYYCESEAKTQCGGEYQELSRFSNRPEQTLVKDSNVSSTGPAKGQALWEGELTVQCGRQLPPLELKRTEGESEPLPAPLPAPPGAPTSVPGERLCIPGTTQACLGPGACSGAQACLESGVGFGPCDCGPNPAGAPNPNTPPSGAAAAGPQASVTPGAPNGQGSAGAAASSTNSTPASSVH
jgi:hypothetical protein